MQVKVVQKRIKCLSAAALVLLLSGCGLISDRSSEYVNADPGQDIVVPGDLDKVALRSKYPIPTIENAKALPAEYELPKPPDATAAIIVEPYQIEQFGDETWLQLFSSPSEVWPLIQLFWSEYQLSLKEKVAKSGYQATVPIQESTANQALMKELEQTDYSPLVIAGMSFQLKLSHGVRRNTSEVQVRALLPYSNEEVSAPWVAESINPRLEKAVLELLGDFITSDLVASRHSYLASEIGGSSRVRLLDDAEKGASLQMDLTMARAKNELEQAIESAGIIIAERDLENNQIYVSFLSEDDLISWYHTDSMVEDRKLQKNILIEFSQIDSGTVEISATSLNEEFEKGVLNELMSLIYEHTS